MIRIIPYISIAQGKVVKNTLANIGNTIYPIDPITLAETFALKSFDTLFLTDLDGAREDAHFNISLLQLIKSFSGLHVNFSGGIRSDDAIDYVFENNADSITSASIPVLYPDLFTSWLISYGRDRIILGADVLDEHIVTKGRQQNTGIKAADLIAYFADRGLKYVKLTDIGKAGALEGPNFDLIVKLRTQFPHLHFLYAGGVHNVDDIYLLNELGVSGVIIAKAFYEDLISIDKLAAINKGN